jgi:hypothetical protein
MVHVRGESMLAATISAEEVEKKFRIELLLGEVGQRGETRGRTARESLVNGRPLKRSSIKGLIVRGEFQIEAFTRETFPCFSN